MLFKALCIRNSLERHGELPTNLVRWSIYTMVEMSKLKDYRQVKLANLNKVKVPKMEDH